MPRALRSFLRTAWCGIALASAAGVFAQCGTPIAVFPHYEGFESGPVWTSGGTNSDWAWGTPAHPYINSAGGGTNSWCVGGLTGSSYSDDERSWLESPCYDFSALDHPWISFKISWRLETQYDGMVLQYSLDQGNTYSNVGAYGDPTDCLNANWYNTNNVLNLSGASPRHGWSGGPNGSCQVGTSGGWITAKHCLMDLAHEPSVRFRFYFGAGHQCNNYDGVAIDDVLIQNAPANVASFTYGCTGNTVDFTSQGSGCPNSFNWDFGDPGSGAGNVATTQNATHTFSGPGTYTVTHLEASDCAGTASTTMDITIIDASVQVSDALCGPGSGSATATVDNVASPNYLWTPGGQTTATATGLSQGTYGLTISAPGACPFTWSGDVHESGNGMSVQDQVTNTSCANTMDGSASVLVSGGTPGYGYAWAPSGGTLATITGLAPGDQTCTITDAAGCTTTHTVTIAAPSAVSVDTPADVSTCAGTSVSLTATAAGGTPGYTYAWSPAGPDITPATSGPYTVVATDTHGCTSAPAQVDVQVGAAIVPAFIADITSGCAPLCVTFSAGADVPGLTYAWDFGDGGAGSGWQAAHCYTDGGTFGITLTITDASGCSGIITRPDLVNAWPQPRAAFSPSAGTVTTEHPTILFADGSANTTQWLWHFGDAQGSYSTERSPAFTFPGFGCYTVMLVAANDSGCVDTDEQEICVEDPYAVYVPNTFTPNGDGINDVFGVVGSVREPGDYRLIIFDRWGRELFNSITPYQGWDGAGVPEGVYIWKLWVRDTESKLHEHTGHITLLR